MMKELNKSELEQVNGALDGGVCSTMVVGASSLVGAGIGAYTSAGFGAGLGFRAGGVVGGFLAAYMCY